MPRIRTVDLMLTATVVLWALNLTLSKYLLTHGLEPLTYSGLRYSAAAAIFVAISARTERAVLLRGRHAAVVLVVAVALLVTNQLAFVYALRFTTASTVGLFFGATPVFTALVAVALGMERVGLGFGLASAASFAGVALVALGSGGGLSGDLKGDGLALWAALSWGTYSVAIASLMRVWSPVRISAAVLPPVALLLALVGLPQLLGQDYGSLSASVWLVLAAATLGPLVLTNLLWFTALERVGPSHATLFANLQPFVAVLFAVVLLSEHVTLLQVGGGLAIAVGVALAWRSGPARVPPE